MKKVLATYSVPFGVILWIILIIVGYHFNMAYGALACIIPILIMALIA
jgi:hypothetical protein